MIDRAKTASGLGTANESTGVIVARPDLGWRILNEEYVSMLPDDRGGFVLRTMEHREYLNTYSWDESRPAHLFRVARASGESADVFVFPGDVTDSAEGRRSMLGTISAIILSRYDGVVVHPEGFTAMREMLLGRDRDRDSDSVPLGGTETTDRLAGPVAPEFGQAGGGKTVPTPDAVSLYRLAAQATEVGRRDVGKGLERWADAIASPAHLAHKKVHGGDGTAWGTLDAEQRAVWENAIAVAAQTITGRP